MAETEKKPLSVSEAAAVAKRRFEAIRLTIVGEVSELTDKRGYANVYFAIKDDKATLSCKMWRNRFEQAGVSLALGSLVQVDGHFTIWPQKGDVKFEVVSVSLAGEGRLRQQVAMLAQRLRSEGLMDPAAKRALPLYPARIGLVTSPRGAAVHDVLRTLRRRYPLARVYFAGVPVEGRQAAGFLLEGLRCVYKAGVDVILLVRGGGSFEDLMPFNDEGLARAMAKCPIPIVTGIGHEPDNSIADMVADFRASTPTAAAEAVAPDIASVSRSLDASGAAMARRMELRLNAAFAELSRMAERPVFSREGELLGDWAMHLDYADERMHKAIPDGLQRCSGEVERLRLRFQACLIHELELRHLMLGEAGKRLMAALPRLCDGAHADVEAYRLRLRLCGEGMLDSWQHGLERAASQLSDLSPLAVIGRGYSVVHTAEGELLRSTGQVEPGSRVRISLSDGKLACLVEDVVVQHDDSERG